MNNSIVLERVEETPLTGLMEREGELAKIIEAIRAVRDSAEWSSLKELVFDGVVRDLERQLFVAAKRSEVDTKEIYRLQGQLMWAKRYADLDQLANVYRLELSSVRKHLNPPTEREIAPDTL